MGIGGIVAAAAVAVVGDAFLFHVKYHFLHLPNVPLSWCSSKDDGSVSGCDSFVAPLPLLMAANCLCGWYERAFLFFSQSSRNDSSYCGIAHEIPFSLPLSLSLSVSVFDNAVFNYAQSNEHQHQPQQHKYSSCDSTSNNLVLPLRASVGYKGVYFIGDDRNLMNKLVGDRFSTDCWPFSQFYYYTKLLLYLISLEFELHITIAFLQ